MTKELVKWLNIAESLGITSGHCLVIPVVTGSKPVHRPTLKAPDTNGFRGFFMSVEGVSALSDKC